MIVSIPARIDRASDSFRPGVSGFRSPRSSAATSWRNAVSPVSDSTMIWILIFMRHLLRSPAVITLRVLAQAAIEPASIKALWPEALMSRQLFEDLEQ